MKTLVYVEIYSYVCIIFLEKIEISFYLIIFFHDNEYFFVLVRFVVIFDVSGFSKFFFDFTTIYDYDM